MQLCRTALVILRPELGVSNDGLGDVDGCGWRFTKTKEENAFSIRRQIRGRFWQSAPPRHIWWQLVWEKKHISTPMQYCSLSSFIWKMDNATKFGISMTLIGNIKSFELSLKLPSLISIIRKLDFYSNWSGSSNTLRLPACCMNQDIHNLVTQTSNEEKKPFLCKI